MRILFTNKGNLRLFCIQLSSGKFVSGLEVLRTLLLSENIEFIYWNCTVLKNQCMINQMYLKFPKHVKVPVHYNNSSNIEGNEFNHLF